MFGMHQTGHVTEDYLLHRDRDAAAGRRARSTATPPSSTTRRAAGVPPTTRSDAELAALTSPRVRAALDAAGIELITYRDL